MAAIRMLNYNGHMQKRTYRAKEMNIRHDDDEMYERYRFRQDSINYICELVRWDIDRQTNRGHAIPVESQVKLALRFYASGSFLNCVGDTLGYHKSTVSRVVRDVSEVLSSKADQFIQWPTSNSYKNKCKDAFYQTAHFPGVIGCVDGTHVRIQAPSEYEYAFVNRKNFHSINVQAICDGEGRFTNIVAKWPGSCHDSHIFKTSRIGRYLEANYRGMEFDGILLGDSGYACKPYLMTPFLQPANRNQEKFNEAHKRTRVAIEKVFGRWKRRFHCLHGELRMAPDRVCNIIMACAVLHNIAILMNDRISHDEEEASYDDDDDGNNFPPNNFQNGLTDGRRVREYIANTYFV